MTRRPPASSPEALARMKAVRHKDTKPELDLQRAVRRLRLRFEVDVSPVPTSRRRADLVFKRSRVAVLVHGCFWHSCPKHLTIPKTNREWWIAKLEGNRQRDADTEVQFRAAGWKVIRVWAHEDMLIAADKIARIVRGRRKKSDGLA